jgi:hypothetical protein
MKFLERAAMKILERGMRNRDRTLPETARAARAPLTGEIVLPENPTPEEIQQMHAQLVYYQTLAAQRQAELAELQRLESLGNIEEHHREKLVREYEVKIERLNLTVPGGLRSQPLAEADEDQELVNVAWERFCTKRRTGFSRLG